MDLTQFTTASFVIVGLINGVSFASNKQWKSFAKFMIATLAGLTFGFLGWFNITGPEMGLAVGIGSSGVYKVAQIISKK